MIFSTKKMKTPVVLQMEKAECGAACLGIILGYYGRFVPIEELRYECGVSRDGTKASSIVKASKRYGLTCKGASNSTEQVKKIGKPFVAFWEFNHFIVIERFTRKYVFINDPATGRRRITYSEFDVSFTGVVLTFEWTDAFEKGGKKNSSNVFLLELIKLGRKEIRLVVYIGFLALLPGLILPIFSKVFVDQIIVRNFTSWVPMFLAIFCLFIAVKVFLDKFLLDVLSNLNRKISLILNVVFIGNILKLHPSFFLHRSAAEMGARQTSIRELAGLITGELSTSIVKIFSIIFFTGVLFYFNVGLTLLSFFLVFINVLILIRYFEKTKIESHLIVQNKNKLFVDLYNGVSIIESIKASGQEHNFVNRVNAKLASNINASQKSGLLNYGLTRLPSFISKVNTVLLVVFGGSMVMSGDITIGILMTYLIFINYFYEPIITIVRMFVKVQEIYGTSIRVSEIINAHSETESNEANLVTENSIEFKDITFGYNVAEPALFDKFNLKIKAGEKIGLVGASGSGKSTLAKILTKLHKPWDGSVLIGGKSISEIPSREFSNSVGVVDQFPLIFEGTIKNVLTLWDDSIEDEDIVSACKDALIHADIVRRPNGYNGQIEENGKNFSGGQIQKLEIARALMGNPDILILDEATSALDPISEYKIKDNIKNRNITAFIIAHRISSIKDCDRIIVLDKGKIIEEGNHDELMSCNGKYAELVSLEV